MICEHLCLSEKDCVGYPKWELECTVTSGHEWSENKGCRCMSCPDFTCTKCGYECWRSFHWDGEEVK